ncbi:putative HTH-type transcriptional regulator [Limihaloglobus sulfuriphilus]|uniref:Putative HTH-type transcriptional regulator n=1 Tax=Limihaloglobus sulfuriphilus TaxID=1851148 RepID=A0A1Q2MCI2_9BACT|nr:metalloregulator ArsR/SmtB family transcription factor [Limihaloglobus sulfuriphilus]AQQ70007.1 putative HTH-type transcriptional regulator [Limihaloglobus sulfuriphilus]
MDTAKMQIYQLKAQIIQAAAHPIRLAVIEYLADGEQCVCDIVDYVGAQRSNVSRHLSVMLRAGVLDCRKDGLKMMYSLKTPCIVKFLSCVEQALKERIEGQAAILSKME